MDISQDEETTRGRHSQRHSLKVPFAEESVEKKKQIGKPLKKTTPRDSDGFDVSSDSFLLASEAIEVLPSLSDLLTTVFSFLFTWYLLIKIINLYSPP